MAALDWCIFVPSSDNDDPRLTPRFADLARRWATLQWKAGQTAIALYSPKLSECWLVSAFEDTLRRA